MRIQKLLLPLCGLAALACPASTPPRPPTTPPSAASKPAERVVWQKSKSGLGFRLSNADPERPDRPKLAKATPLDDKARAAVLARMPKFTAPAETRAVALREKSIPAPRPGETIKSEFPPRIPSSGPPAVAAKANYEVTRHAPEGPVSVAPNLSISFSEPMVAVTSHLELSREKVPVRLTPEPPGHWRWVGTQTLFFEPKGERFPMATAYQVEIPAATKSASGASLVKDRKWKFETPTLGIKDAFPENWGDPVDLEPVVFVEFNQRIDKNALLPSLAIRAGKELHDVRLATEDEIVKDEDVRSLAEQAEPGRWIALKPRAPLPKGALAEILIKKGAPSAEGPRRTDSDLTQSFHVRGSMSLVTANCGWSEGCPPLAAWSVQFSNPIDDKSFDPKTVKVDPELIGMRIDVSSRYLTVRGRSKGRTKYTLTFAPEIKDSFEQNLDQPAKTTIQVGEAEPMLFPEQDSMLVVDPAFGPKLSVYSVNRPLLKVRLYAVEPGDWESYMRFRQNWDWDGRLTAPPGRLVDTRTVKPKGERDALVETQIDLGPVLKSGFGQILAIVEPPTQPKPRDRWSYREREWVRAWVQVTKLGLTAFRDPTDTFAWVTDLASGAPMRDTTVSVFRGGTAKTGADGIARIPLGFRGQHLLAKRDADLAFIPGDGVDTFSARSMSDFVRWFVFDDRKLYKPGERVHLKGWIRTAHSGKNGDLGRYSSRGADIRWTVNDPRGAELAKGKVDTDDTDGFTLAFNLPKNANLGSASVRLEADGGGYGRVYSHPFSIEEFRRPEFEVTADISQGPHFVGKHALATVAATYFAGGGLADAETAWEVRAQDAYFTPPNRAAYHFGKQRRWTWWGSSESTERSAKESWKSKTDGDGRHRLRIDFDALEPAYPRQIDFEATVTDVNRQAWTARAGALVHPASVTVGIREESRVLKSGSNAQLDMIVTDIDGAIVTGRPVSIKMSRIEQTYRGRRRIESEAATETCSVQSAAEAQRCSLKTSGGGLHRITASTSDAHGRPSQTQLEIWVLGADPAENPTVGLDRVEIVPNKKEYRGGETAELLVIAPFAPAEGVLTLRRDGVVHLKRVRLEKKTETLSVKLDPSWIPNLYVGVDLVGTRVREGENGEPDPSLPKRPAAASGEAELSVPPKDRSLEIKVTPEKKALAPGGSTRIGLDVKDTSGRAVAGAAVALVVVDESVLALAGYELPDPLAVLYPSRSAGVEDYESRLKIALMHPDTARVQLKAKQKPQTANGHGFGRGSLGLSGMGEGGGGRGVASEKKVTRSAAPAAKPAASAPPPPPGPPRAEPSEKDATGKKQSEAPIRVRSNFNPLAAFVPRLTTDAQGHATASVKLPDNLTRYRVMAVAAQGERRFGASESDVTARLPLMVRPSLPRFLNFGDRLSLPVVLQNQTASPLSVDIAVRASNLQVQNPSAFRVEVPANDRVEVRFPAAAAQPGTAKVQVGAISKVGNDASEVELPVWTPASTEAFASYGQVDQGAIAQPVKLPSGVYTQLGQLEITTASTALQGLTDAVLYLVRYPFECNEQLSSRMLAIAALKDVLGAFKAPGLPPKGVLIATVAADIEKLGQRQHYSGGWDWWRRDRTPDPFVSVHVAHALVRAKGKGFKVPKPMLDSALKYLRAIKGHFPPWYAEQARRTVRAFALSVRARAGQAVAVEARELYREGNGVNGLSLDAIGWLLPILSKDPAASTEVAAIRRYIENHVSETAGKAHFVTKVSDDAHVILESDRRTDGIVLEAMIDDTPENDVIPKVAQGLLAHRKRGRWYNTQDNVYVLLALDRYFAQYEKATPDFLARAWLGQRLAAEHPFKGRSVDRQHVDIPLTYLGAKPENVTLSKEGAGRLYFRIGMQYVPKDLRPPPAEHGFSVSRLYEGADKPDDVKRDKDGTWRVKLGSRVRVRLAMVAPGRRYHVALVDPIPAGFEPMNPALATTGTIPRDTKQATSSVPWWWASAWYEHQNMRDERVEAFTSLLYGGVYDYSYVSRATTPGDFVVPPPKAEEMYDPETFGRGPGDRVVIQ